MTQDAEYTDIGRRQAEARKLLGLTQHEMAAKIEVPMRTISDNERGISVAGGRVLASYCELGIRSDWLLTGRGMPFSAEAPREIADMLEAADDSQISLAHFDNGDVRSSYFVGSEERRKLARISISQELGTELCGGEELGLPDKCRLFTMSFTSDCISIIDGAITKVDSDGTYAILENNQTQERRIQVLPFERGAVMSNDCRGTVLDVREIYHFELIGKVVGSLVALA